MKTFHFISGMPRSGSQLLCNILNQNPCFHVSPTSGILDIIFSVRNNWDQLIEFQANPDEEAKKRVLRGILESYYANREEPICFDKSRGWLAYIEMAEMILEKKAKILVPVRDIRDILSSFEKLYRQSAATRQIAQERANYFKWQTVEGRCEIWASSDQPVGLAYNRIKDALSRGFQDRMHFVKYTELTKYPARTLMLIYNFLEEDYFEHDFNNVEQVIFEHDDVYGLGSDLHTIRPKVEPQPSQCPIILGETVAQKYQGLELW
ncbi:hypothetical protein COS75_02105 [Candidatus Pacearchaeota archaeon CG06_land_8_20_14_3_00_35_12]|nr:MAG: hypothetical protein COS75_02105 [Candidatus Pacearchaeota archaeon CG06_land_8_20_14_3_00_35_12]